MRHINLITRALLFIFLFAGVINPSFSQKAKVTGPQKITATSQMSPKVSTVAKLYMVIAYLETKPIYKDGMSQEEFLNSMFAGFHAQSEPALRKYFQVVYGYHKQNLTPDDVYLKADERAFVAVYNDFVSLHKSQMTKAEFKRVVGLEAIDNSKGGRGPWWFNWLRKFIDWIDDHWPPKPEKK